MNIKLLKLVTNEEILCEVEEKGNDIVLKNPIILIAIPGEDGQMGLGLVPWMPASKTREMWINREHIVCINEPTQEIHNHYDTQYGAGLILPEQGIQI